MDPILEALLRGVAAPALLCGALLVAAWRPWRRAAGAHRGAWGGAVAFTAGVILAHAEAMGHWPAIRAGEVMGWLPHLAVAAALVCLIEPALRRAPAASLTLRAAIGAAAAWLLCRPFLESQWPAAPGALRVAGIAAVTLAAWTSHEALARRTPGPVVPMALLVGGAGASGSLVLAYTAKPAQIAGALSAMCGAALLVALWNRRTSPAAGAAAVASVAIAFLCFVGHLYSKLPAGAALLLVGAPSAAWAGSAPGARRLAPLRRGLVQLGAVAAVGGGAVILTWKAV